MIIFGWGRQTLKQIGIVFKTLCRHCNNEEFWVLTKITTWFTLFFIPVLPYSVKYFLSCPVCQYGFNLNNEQTEQLRPLAEINQLLIDGQITDTEHQLRMNQLSASSAKTVEAEIVEPKSTAVPTITPPGEISYCSKCGTKVTKEIKFCGNCGVKNA